MSLEASEPVLARDATAQAELVRSGSVSAVELVSLALARAEAQSELEAITVLLPERALARAETATGPFAGVPIVLKDAGQELAGTPLWMGTNALKSIDYHSTLTTPLTQMLEDLGFVIVGKAAVPELMTGITTEPPIGPPTRNPWDTRLTVGGSSGGSAAAVAAHIVPLAHGSDSTGSLRYPASCCGLFTLRPTTGRVPSRLLAGIDDPFGMHSDFVLTRSARDLSAVLAELSPPASEPPEPIRRIGVLKAMPFGLPVEPQIDHALAEVADVLRERHEIVAIEPTFFEEFGAVIGNEVATLTDAHRAAVTNWIEAQLGRPATSADLSAEVLESAQRGRDIDATTWAESRQRVNDAAGAAARAWTSQADALLLPTFTVMPWPVGQPHPDGSLAGLICSLANFSGQPSAAIPTVQGGVPLGVQLQGSHGTDELLLDIVASVRSDAPTPPSV